MTNEVAEKIVRGITDKIECNTVDIDDWAEFWGFTRKEYEEFLDMAIKALKQEPKWIPVDYDRYPDTYPKPFQEVWITDGYAEVKHRAYDGTRNIKAWMPYIKPEPYEVESEVTE